MKQVRMCLIRGRRCGRVREITAKLESRPSGLIKEVDPCKACLSTDAPSRGKSSAASLDTVTERRA